MENPPNIYPLKPSPAKGVASAAESYYSAVAGMVAQQALECIKDDVRGLLSEISKEVAAGMAGPFERDKIWFTQKQLCERWGCGVNFVRAISSDALPVTYLDGNIQMKRYLAIDVYKYEGLIKPAQHKRLKEYVEGGK